MSEAVIGSKLFAEINPLEAANNVSYQWNADGEPIPGETTGILIIKKEYYGKIISLSVNTNSDSFYQSDINVIDTNLKVVGKECLPNVFQCNYCDSDQTTCLECKIGQGADECKSCSETYRSKCLECNGNAILNEDGKCISTHEVQLVKQSLVRSSQRKLTHKKQLIMFHISGMLMVSQSQVSQCRHYF